MAPTPSKYQWSSYSAYSGKLKNRKDKKAEYLIFKMRPFYFLKMVWERESNPFQTCDALPDIKITLDHEPPPHNQINCFSYPMCLADFKMELLKICQLQCKNRDKKLLRNYKMLHEGEKLGSIEIMKRNA